MFVELNRQIRPGCFKEPTERVEKGEGRRKKGEEEADRKLRS
jgi:hypothetical protein